MKNIVIGTTFIDIKGFPDSEFMTDGRNAGEIEYIHGGVGRNIAENMARCGQPPVYISGVDDSPLARDVLDRIRREGIDTDYVIKADHALGTWLAIFDDKGDVVCSISRRPELGAISDLLDEQADEIFRNADSIAVEIDMDPEIIRRVFACADRFQIPVFGVISNMQIALKQKALTYPLYCLVCNLQEAELVMKADLHDRTPEEVLSVMEEEMSAYPVKKMVVTMGEKGAVYYDQETGEKGFTPAAPVEVCDTTGAGDAFFTGVVLALTGKKSMEEACRTGAMLASQVIATKENVCPKGAVDFA